MERELHGTEVLDNSGNHSNIRSLGSKIMQYIPGAVAPVVFGLLTPTIYTRVFNTQEYGRYSIIMTMTGLLAAVSTQWLQQAVNRYVPAQRENLALQQLKDAAALSLIVIVAVILLLSMITGAGAVVLSPVWRQAAWAVVALALSTALYNGVGSMLQAEMRATRYSVYQFVSGVARFALMALLVFGMSRSPLSMIWAGTFSLLVVIPFMWREAGLPTVIDALKRKEQLWAQVRQYASYGFPMVGWFLSASFLDVGDRYVIELFRGPGEVGIYSATYGLVSGAAGMIAAPILLAAHPFLIKTWGNGDRAQTTWWLSAIVAWFVVTGACLVGALLVIAQDVSSILLGAAFREGYVILPVVLAGNLFWQLGMYVHKPLEFTGQTRRMLWYSVAAALANMTLNLVFVPRYGFVAAAYATLAAYAFYVVVAAWASHSILPWRIPFLPIVLSLVTVAMGVQIAIWFRFLVQAKLGYWAGLSTAVSVLAVLDGFTLYALIRYLLRRRLS